MSSPDKRNVESSICSSVRSASIRRSLLIDRLSPNCSPPVISIKSSEIVLSSSSTIVKSDAISKGSSSTPVASAIFNSKIKSSKSASPRLGRSSKLIVRTPSSFSPEIECTIPSELRFAEEAWKILPRISCTSPPASTNTRSVFA